MVGEFSLNAQKNSIVTIKIVDWLVSQARIWSHLYYLADASLTLRIVEPAFHT